MVESPWKKYWCHSLTLKQSRVKELIKFSKLEELPEVADFLMKNFINDRVFAFYGNMGVGKTTLIKVICEKFQVEDVVSSPTFAIINEYYSEEQGQIFHFDFYRLKNIQEAMDLGLDEYFYSKSYCFIEWPDKIEGLLPENFVYLRLEEKNGERVIYQM